MAVTVLPALSLCGCLDVDTAAGALVVIGVFVLARLVLWSVFYRIARGLDRRRARTSR